MKDVIKLKIKHSCYLFKSVRENCYAYKKMVRVRKYFVTDFLKQTHAF